MSPAPRALTRQQRRQLERLYAKQRVTLHTVPTSRAGIAAFWCNQRPHRRFARWVKRLVARSLAHLNAPLRGA